MTDAEATTSDVSARSQPSAPRPGWTLPWEAGWLIAGFAALVPAWGLRGAPGPLYEEGFTVLHAELVLGGQTPGVDFHALYGPLGPWLMAGWFKLVGPSIGVQRIIGALLLIAIVLGVRQLLRPWGRSQATVAAVVASVTVYSASTLVAVAWWFGFAAVIWGILLIRPAGCRGTPPHGGAAHEDPGSSLPPRSMIAFVAGGILFGLSLGFRPDLILAVGLAGGAAVLAGRSHAAVARRWRPVAAGFVAGLLPLAIYTLVVGPVRAWRVLVVGPVITLRPYRSLPPPPFDELQGLSRSLRLSPDWPLPAPPLAAQVALWFWVSVAATLALVAAAWLTRRTAPALLPIAGLALATLPQLVQRPDLGHLALTTAVPLAALPVAIATLLPARKRKKPATREPKRPSDGFEGSPVRDVASDSSGGDELGWLVVVPLVLVLVLFPAPALGPWTRAVTGQSTRDAKTVTVGDRSLPVSASIAPPAQRVLDQLSALARPEDRLIVGPSDLTRAYDNAVALYTLFPDLTVGTYHSEMDPGFTNVADSSLPGELARADWVLVSPSRPQLREPNRSAQAGDPAAQRAFDDRFCPVIETQMLSLWGLCDNPNEAQPLNDPHALNNTEPSAG